MEKISNIVRGNSRVASVDLKNAAPVRPGAPSMGRPIGVSTTAGPIPMSTAEKATAVHLEMEARKAAAHDQIVTNMADDFFMSRIRRPVESEGQMEAIGAGVNPEFEADELAEEVPAGYTPRGSYIDVRV